MKVIGENIYNVTNMDQLFGWNRLEFSQNKDLLKLDPDGFNMRAEIDMILVAKTHIRFKIIYEN